MLALDFGQHFAVTLDFDLHFYGILRTLCIITFWLIKDGLTRVALVFKVLLNMPTEPINIAEYGLAKLTNQLRSTTTACNDLFCVHGTRGLV